MTELFTYIETDDEVIKIPQNDKSLQKVVLLIYQQEQELTKYKRAFNEIYDEAVVYYGHKDNWTVEQSECGSYVYGAINDRDLDDNNCGGKKARELQAEFKELRGE